MNEPSGPSDQEPSGPKVRALREGGAMTSRADLVDRLRKSWHYLAVFLVVLLVAGSAAFFLTRDLVSSDRGATAESSPAPESADSELKRILEETMAKIAADRAKGVFTGELGEYFYIARPEKDPLPPELSGDPYTRGSCEPDFVAVQPGDTPLYVELPSEIDGIKITPTTPPQAVKCAGEIVSVQQAGRLETSKGPGDVGVAKGYLHHPRYVTSFGFSRERYDLAEIADKPALIIASLGWPDASHITVILEPYSGDMPGVTLGIDGDLTRAQVAALAERLAASTDGEQ
jgi:hypothetical protein